MAIFPFARSIVEGKPIRLFNHGKMRRDSLHIDDVTPVIQRLIDHVPRAMRSGTAPARIYNVGNHKPTGLMHVVELLEQELGRKAIRDMLPMQPGDVMENFADVDDLMIDTGFRPQISTEDGIRGFVAWYRDHYWI